eukprot:TRINITY_DN1379_c0_g1_i2.p1 TRINITY_DN1379_c0_g1~~TRINITY_DN1379_c0_g1_i2.p1  ORF type:complete len:1235 (-),score=414.71 TRINITY_DN1379_c0_g1_i2:42-3746(-)
MSFSVASTLEKMNSRDKDFRYMAAADLEVELKKDTFKMDPDSEKKLTAMVLKLLEDNSNQVQEVAVKCLGPLSKRVKEQQVTDIVDSLCNHLLNDKKGAEELRDIANIGLKTVIAEIPSEPPTLSASVIKKLTPRLMTGISSNQDKLDIITYCLEALNDLLTKFSSQMTADHEKLLKVVEPQLGSKRTASRKWAINCLGNLAVTVPDAMFADLVKNLISQIQDSSQKQDRLHTYMQAVEAISRSVGYRLGKFIPEICPLIIKYCEDSKSGDELKEDCFQCFESLISRCPKEITPYLPKIIDLCLVFIKYDPNYAEDDEGDDMETDEGDEGDEDEGDEEGEEENYSDDDDMSWKVRRSSTKCLSVVITTRPEMLQDIYSKVAPVLIARFREREENVKLDVFNAFIDLLKQTNSLVRRNPELSTLATPLRGLVPKVITGITKQLKERSVKTRSGAFALLKELVTVLKGSLSDNVAALIPGIQAALGDKSTNSTLKIDGLTFLRLLLATHDPSSFQPHVKAVAPSIFKAVRDPYYRISAEGLRVSCELVRVLRAENASFNYKPFVPELFNATLEKLKVQDIDQEVKESAITCMGLIVANFGEDLKSELPSVLNILQDRLGNEITRLTAVNALYTIANSKTHPDLGPILAESVKSLSSFLRQTNRQLKQSSLSALGVIVRNYGSDKKANDLFKQLLTELAPLINDSDLHLTHLALSICASMLQVFPGSATLIQQDVLPKAIDLFKSHLLQGLALDSLLNMLSELVKINSKGLGFSDLLERLLSLVNGQKEMTKPVLSNIAKGVSALCVATDAKQRDATVSRFIKDLSRKEEWAKHLALYCLGEIGRRTDLSSHSDLQKTILTALESPNEETRQAASFALGNVAVGSLQKYLPQMLEEIKKNPKIKYLLLHSLREVIVRQSTSSEGANALKSHQKELLPLLFENCENEEEGTRNVVAECLGKLTVLSPQELVPALVERLSSSSERTRGTIVTALKFAIVERSQPVDQLLRPQMARFLDLLKDKDLNVRRNTLLMLNYAAHNKPFLIRDILPDYMPLIFNESKVKPELIREVDLGPFKHKVDDGLEVRKAAFECMYTLLDSCLDRVNVPAFVTNLVDGLKDQNDIKTLSHLMLIRLASLSGASLLEGLDQLVEPLRATIGTKAKEGAVQQEVERNDELIRSALRAISAISRVPNVESNIKWEEFLKTTVKVGELGDKYAAIRAEGEHNIERSTGDAMDLS